MKRSGDSADDGRSGTAKVAGPKERRIGRDFTGQLGRLVILWGDIEALVRTLELMRGHGQGFRAKTDDELKAEYRAGWRPFDKHLKAVLPHQTSMAHGILTLKEVRDFALHGAVVQWGNAQGEQDAIMHVDAPATIFAQGGFMSRPLQTIIPKTGMSNGDGKPGPAVLTTGGLRRACDKLAGYVYDLRLFRTVLQVKEGKEIRFEVSGGEPPPRTSRSIEPGVLQNPADEIGHDKGTALRLGEFCLSFSLLDQTIRTLEIMRADQPGRFQAHTEPKVEAWYKESPRQLTARLNFVLGKDTGGTQAVAELVKFRNFVYHNPISMLGVGSDGHRAVFVHRDLVAIRDAQQRPDEDKNEARPIRDWGITQHAGTTHIAVDELVRKTEEAKWWQEKLLVLVEQGHRRASGV